ncbi:MAG: hypothetical protein RRY79_01075 [Clostridia bacterium]
MKKIKKIQMIFASVMTIALILFLIFAPGSIIKNVNRNIYREWREIENPDRACIITVWHIVKFKAPEGSITVLLDEIASGIEKENFGIYFEVLGMDENEYRERLTSGDSCDIISFPMGLIYSDELLSLETSLTETLKSPLKNIGMDGDLRALPYMYSYYQLILNEDALAKKNLILDDIDFLNDDLNGKNLGNFSGNPIIGALLGIKSEILPSDAFFSNASAALLSDARMSFDAMHQYENGKGSLTGAYDISDYTDLVQLLGIEKNIANEKMQYAENFIRRLLDKKAQKKISEMQAFSVLSGGDIGEIAGKTIANSPIVPNAFLYKHEIAALIEYAKKTTLDSASGSTEFKEQIGKILGNDEILLSNLLKRLK